MTKTATAASLKYAQRLKLSDDEKKVRSNDFVVRGAALNLDKSILSQEAAIAEKERERDEYLSKSEVDWNHLAEMDMEIADLNRGLEALAGFKAELF